MVRLPNLLISLVGILMAASLTIILFVLVEYFIRYELTKDDIIELKDANIICTVIFPILNTLVGSYSMPPFLGSSRTLKTTISGPTTSAV